MQKEPAVKKTSERAIDPTPYDETLLEEVLDDLGELPDEFPQDDTHDNLEENNNDSHSNVNDDEDKDDFRNLFGGNCRGVMVPVKVKKEIRLFQEYGRDDHKESGFSVRLLAKSRRDGLKAEKRPMEAIEIGSDEDSSSKKYHRDHEDMTKPSKKQCKYSRAQ